MSKNNPAYNENRPVQVELGIIGLGAGFSSLEIEDSLLSFKYSLLNEAQSDENQFTFTIELINPDHKLENLIQLAYSKMYPDIKGAPPGSDLRMEGYPKLLIRWGYGETLEDGRSQVHIVSISNVQYRFTSGKEKVLTITAKDMLSLSTQILGSSYISRQAPILAVGTGSEKSGDRQNPEAWLRTEDDKESSLRPALEIVMELVKKVLSAVPGSTVADSLDKGTSDYIDGLLSNYAMFDQFDAVKKYVFYGQGLGRIPSREPGGTIEDAPFGTSRSETMSKLLEMNPNARWQDIYEKYSVYGAQKDFLRNLGFQISTPWPDDMEGDGDYYLIKAALVGGSHGMVTNVVSHNQLKDLGEDYATMANDMNSQLDDRIFNTPLHQTKLDGGISLTTLEIGMDITDFDGGYYGDPALDGIECYVTTTLSDLGSDYLANYKPLGGPVYGVNQVNVIPVFGTFSLEQYKFIESRTWRTQPTGRAKLNPIAEKVIDSSTSIRNFDPGDVKVTDLLLKLDLMQENETVEKFSIQKFDPSKLSKEDLEEFFGGRNIPNKGESFATLISPAGESPFKTVEKVINALNRYLPNRGNQYYIYSIPSNHLNSRNISMQQAADSLLKRETYDMTFLISSYELAIGSELLNPEASKGSTPETMKIYSFDDVNLFDGPPQLKDSSLLGNPVYASEWAKLTYGVPNSIVKFFDFTSEFWYLVNYFRGVSASRKARGQFDSLLNKRTAKAILNFVSEAYKVFDKNILEDVMEVLKRISNPILGAAVPVEDWAKTAKQRKLSNNPAEAFLSKLSAYAAPVNKIPLKLTEADMMAFKEIILVAQSGLRIMKTSTSFPEQDKDAIQKLVKFYNSAGTEGLKSLFSTLDSPLSGYKTALISLGTPEDTVTDAIEKGIKENTNYAEQSFEPLYYVLQATKFNNASNASIESQAKADLMATRLLNATYQTHIRVKTLGIPEMDTVNEIYKRKVFFVVRDISRERYLDMDLNSSVAEPNKGPRVHWLSGQYRPIGIVHTITPSEGYITEFKMYRDPRAVQDITDALESGI